MEVKSSVDALTDRLINDAQVNMQAVEIIRDLQRHNRELLEENQRFRSCERHIVPLIISHLLGEEEIELVVKDIVMADKEINRKIYNGMDKLRIERLDNPQEGSSLKFRIKLE